MYETKTTILYTYTQYILEEWLKHRSEECGQLPTCSLHCVSFTVNVRRDRIREVSYHGHIEKCTNINWIYLEVAMNILIWVLLLHFIAELLTIVLFRMLEFFFYYFF